MYIKYTIVDFMNKKIKIGIIIILILLLAYVAYYFTEVNHAEEAATKYLNGNDNVNVTKIDNGLFLDGYGNDTALIFYPGAKNEYTAYLPMFMDIASKGVDCYLVKMPWNYAFLGEKEADSIINNSNYSHYILSGHSLGGFAASSYISDTGKGDGVIILSGYPTKEIEKPVLSIYGSEDGVLNMKAYNDSKSLMKNQTEYIIDGGNHAQFAYYGPQNGDNPAKITPESQQNQCSAKILEFIDKLT